MMENSISKAKNALVVFPTRPEDAPTVAQLKIHFCGQVVETPSELPAATNSLRVYACGNIEKLAGELPSALIIQELSYGYEALPGAADRLVSLGQVPVLVHEAGVYFRNLFGTEDYFNQVQAEHVFQELTESTKPSKALRKGIYLTEVTKEEGEEAEERLRFRLLRCSSNLSGPTANYRSADRAIMCRLNEAVRHVFDQETELNHVLAQVYTNTKGADNNGKEVKAKIKAHSDKTKDMPADGLIAFCTFYDPAGFQSLVPSAEDPYDWVYKHKSGLTRLVFKLKQGVEDSSLAKEFSVTLYPNSAFVIPLSTNRLYTHEIRPSMLNVDLIPVRMGYVARCSHLEAIYQHNQTYIEEGGQWLKLEPMTVEPMRDLKTAYYQENSTEQRVEYGKVAFSMNSGDYEKPIL